MSRIPSDATTRRDNADRETVRIMSLYTGAAKSNVHAFYVDVKEEVHEETLYRPSILQHSGQGFYDLKRKVYLPPFPSGICTQIATSHSALF